MMMKYLLVIAVLLVAFWVWRNDRREAQARQQARRNPTAPSAPVPLVACRQCGTHLPETEAVKGRRGWYCSTGHRRLEEETSA